MTLTCLFVDDSPVTADLHSISVVTLMGRHEFDAAVAVPVVVPINERHHPLAGLVLVGEWPARVIRPVFDRTEQGFRVRVVVGDPWPGKGSEHAHLLQP